jgi:putative ABC transport system permease protein
MLKNYWTIAWRNLLRNRTFSLINLVGLSISVAFCLLLFFHIQWERSFDQFHQKKDVVYRVEQSSLFINPNDTPRKSFFSPFTAGEEERNDLLFPLMVGTDMKAGFPEVAGITRFRTEDDQLFVRAENEVYKQKEVIYAEPSFFDQFSFRVLAGDVKGALTDPHKVILAESVAKRYFGSKDPMGRTISMPDDSNRLFTVAAVVADAPQNSSIQYSMILPLAANYRYAMDVRDGFRHSDHFLMVELRPGADRAAFERKMNAWVKTYFIPSLVKNDPEDAQPEKMANYRWKLRPLTECHYNASLGWGHFTDLRALYQAVCIVVVILLLASLNYILITVSNAAARSQEVGVRKVLGAGMLGIRLQSWAETQLLVGIAVGVGLVLAFIGIPLLQSTIHSGVTRADVSWRDAIAGSLVLALLLGFIAGYYPALLISGLRPASILKSFGTFRMNPRLSRVMVVFQFTCCVLLMMAVMVIHEQMKYIQHKDLGFDKNQVLMVDNPSFDRAFVDVLRERLYGYVRTNPGILGSSTMTGSLTGGLSNNGFIINGQQYWVRQKNVGYNFFELLGIKVLEGRAFSPEYATDSVTSSTKACVINESLYKLLGEKVTIGAYDTTMRARIIGVVKDYHFASLTHEIQPQFHMLQPHAVSSFIFKVRAGRMADVIAGLQAEWRSVAKNYPFEYHFLDAAIAQQYESDMRWQRTVQASSFFAVMIACMGLFGLSAIAAANRSKEVGIRKVLGASVPSLAGTLSRGFLGMVVLAIVIAAPFSWWMMNKWLQDFAYRIEIEWWMFAVVGLGAVVIALGTVSFQVFKAARANPVDALRDE